MKSTVYWKTLSELGALTLASILVAASTANGVIPSFGASLYALGITLYAGLRLFRIGSEPLKRFMLATVPILGIIGAGWAWSALAVTTFKTREGGAYLGDVDLARHYKFWACDGPLLTTTFTLILYVMVVVAILVARKHYELACLTFVLAMPVGLINSHHYISIMFDVFD